MAEARLASTMAGVVDGEELLAADYAAPSGTVAAAEGDIGVMGAGAACDGLRGADGLVGPLMRL
jgi:hypothetical protein